MLSTQNRWNVFKCWVTNCANSSQDPKQFVSLPNDPKMREIWLALTGKQWSDMHGPIYFCMDHFIPPYYKEIRPYDASLMQKPLYKMPERICRTCMSIIQSDQLFYVLSFQFPSDLPPNEYHLLRSHQRETLSQMLTFCIPELNLQTNPPPLVCYKCFYNIWMFFVFKIQCNENEKKLRGTMNLVEYGKLVLCRTCPQKYGMSLFNLTANSSMGTLLIKLFLNRYPPDIVPLRVCLKCWNVLYKLDFFYQKCLQIEANMQHVSISGTILVPYSDQSLNLANTSYTAGSAVDLSIRSDVTLLDDSYPCCSKTIGETPSKKVRSDKDIPPPPYSAQSFYNGDLPIPRSDSVIKCVVNYSKRNVSGVPCTNTDENKEDGSIAPSVDKEAPLKRNSNSRSQIKRNLKSTTLPAGSMKSTSLPAENVSSASKSSKVSPQKATDTNAPHNVQQSICTISSSQNEHIMLAEIMVKHYRMLRIDGVQDKIPVNNWKEILEEFVAKGGKDRDLPSLRQIWQTLMRKSLDELYTIGPKKYLDHLIIECVKPPEYKTNVDTGEKIKNATRTDKVNGKGPIKIPGPFSLGDKIGLAEAMVKICKPLYENRRLGGSVTIPENVWQEVAVEFESKTNRCCPASRLKTLWTKLTANVKGFCNNEETLYPSGYLDRIVFECIQRKPLNRKTCAKPSTGTLNKKKTVVEEVNNAKQSTGAPNKKKSVVEKVNNAKQSTGAPNKKKSVVEEVNNAKQNTGTPNKKKTVVEEVNNSKQSTVAPNKKKTVVEETNSNMVTGKRTSSRETRGQSKSPNTYNFRQYWKTSDKLELALMIKREYKMMQNDGTLSKAPWKEILRRIAQKSPQNHSYDRLYSAWSAMKISAVVHEKNGTDMIDEEIWDLLQLHTAIQRSLPRIAAPSSKTESSGSNDNATQKNLRKNSMSSSKPEGKTNNVLQPNTTQKSPPSKAESDSFKNKSLLQRHVVKRNRLTDNYKVDFTKSMEKELLRLEKNKPILVNPWLIIRNVAKFDRKYHNVRPLTLYARWRKMRADAMEQKKRGKLSDVDKDIRRLLSRIDDVNKKFDSKRLKKEGLRKTAKNERNNVKTESSDDDSDTSSTSEESDKEEDVEESDEEDVEESDEEDVEESDEEDVEESDEEEKSESIDDADDNFDEIGDRMNESPNAAIKSEDESEEEMEDVKPNIPQLKYDYISWEDVQKGFQKPIVVSEVIDLSSDEEESKPGANLEDLLLSTIKKEEIKEEEEEERRGPRSEVIVIKSEEE